MQRGSWKATVAAIKDGTYDWRAVQGALAVVGAFLTVVSENTAQLPSWVNSSVQAAVSAVAIGAGAVGLYIAMQSLPPLVVVKDNEEESTDATPEAS